MTVKRYLKPASHTTAPSAVVCLSMVSHEAVAPGGQHALATMEYVSAVGARWDHRKWCQALTCRTASSELFWAWLYERVQPGRQLTVIAHRMGSVFTQLGGWREWEDGRLVYEKQELDGATELLRRRRPCVAVITDPPFILSLRAAGGTINFIDSRNYTDTPPDRLAPDADCSGLADHWAIGPGPAHYQAADLGALKLLRWYTALADLWRQEELGAWRHTAAGLAWSSFRRELKPRQILLDDHPTAMRLARECHFGGEAAAYRVGQITGPVYHLDIRALYLSIMATWPLPVRRLALLQGPTLEQTSEALRAAGGAARVLVKTSERPYPMRRRSGFCNAVGNFRTCLCGPELESALHRGEIEQVELLATYALGDPTAAWAQRWWQSRQDAEQRGDQVTAGLAKLIGNSLSGKFAQYAYNWVTDEEKTPPDGRKWGTWPEIDAATGDRVRWRALAGICQRQASGKDRPESWPIASAWICAIGRERMRAIRAACPPRSVYYQDTDGLLVSEDAFQALSALGWIGDQELGDLRWVATYDSVEILATKAYRRGDEWVMAGRMADAEPDGPYAWRQITHQTAPQICASRPCQAVVLSQLTLRYQSAWWSELVDSDGWARPVTVNQPELIPW